MTRDALIEDAHNAEDYVPDVETKGYHVGTVRQPADEVDTSELVSKFEDGTQLADLKAQHNADEAEEGWGEG